MERLVFLLIPAGILLSACTIQLEPCDGRTCAEKTALKATVNTVLNAGKNASADSCDEMTDDKKAECQAQIESIKKSIAVRRQQ